MPGDALDSWLSAAAQKPWDSALLAGHSGTIQRLRGRLVDRGLSRRRIATKAHWADDRAGL
ncbi:MAG: hypothetical protein ACRCY8_15020 [Dermatophilaceae bacterium]